MFNGIPEEDIIMAPYGVDAERFYRPRQGGGELRVLFVGEITQRKGIAQILAAAKRLSNQNMTFDLVGGGAGHHRDLFAPYEKYVNFRGRLSGDEVVEAFNSADVFIFPSMGDGFGLVILEAMSAGLPVICSSNCAGRDIVRDGENGFVIPPGDADSLVERLVWLDTHRESLAQMGESARVTAQTYTWGRYEQAIADGLDRVFR